MPVAKPKVVQIAFMSAGDGMSDVMHVLYSDGRMYYINQHDEWQELVDPDTDREQEAIRKAERDRVVAEATKKRDAVLHGIPVTEPAE